MANYQTSSESDSLSVSKSSKSESMSESFSWVSFKASMTDATSVWFTSASDGSYSSSESVVKTSLSSDVSHAQTRLARPLSDKTQMRMAKDIAHDLSFFWTTLTSFCVCIIAAKLSVKLLCCLKDKKQCQDCLSWADCYDQSSRRHTIK